MVSGSKARIIKGAAWIGAARIITMLTGLGSTIILARLLVPADFGLVAIASAIAIVISSFTELSLSQALVYQDEPQDHHYDTAFTLNLIRALLLASVIAAAAYPVAVVYEDHRLFEIMLVLGGATLISGFQNPRLVVFQRNLVFWQDFVLGVTEKLSGFIVAALVALIFRSYWAIIAGAIAAQFFRTIVSYFLITHRPRGSLRAARELLSFSGWLSLSNGIQMLNWRADPLILGLFVSPARVGFYSVGDNLSGILLREGLGPVRQTLFPAYSRLRHDMARLRSAYMRAQGLLTLIALPIGAGFAIFAEPIVRLLLGEKWLPVVPVIQVLSLVMAFETIEGYKPLAMALGKTKAMFGREARIFIIRITFMLFGLLVAQRFESDLIMAAIWARAAAAVFNSTWNMHLINRLIDFNMFGQIRIVFRPLFASALMFFIMKPIFERFPVADASIGSLVTLALIGLLGIIIYTFSVVSLWVLSGRGAGAETEFVEITLGLVKNFRGRSWKQV